MTFRGEKISKFIFNLIFDLARIKRAAMVMMMMMMMPVVVRVASIRETAAALVFMSVFVFRPVRGAFWGGDGWRGEFKHSVLCVRG